MDWVTALNAAIGYIEEHLTDTIDIDEISRITACPFPVFQRSFVQITGLTVSEYIRNRRLSCAAYELQNSSRKVLDLALKYGYESADAFRVAFKRLHGVTPTAARKRNTTLTFYCRLSVAITIKGVDRMEYTIMEKDSFTVMGIRRTTPYGGGTWAVVKSDGYSEKIQALSGHFYDLGLCFGFGEDGSNDYMCAVEWDGEDIPGFDTYTYAPATWLIFQAKGAISEHVLNHAWQRINQEFLPQSKYKKSGPPAIERYTVWDDAADQCHVEICIPVTEKS